MEEIQYLTKEQSEKIINEMFERPDVKMFLKVMDWRDRIVGKNQTKSLTDSEGKK